VALWGITQSESEGGVDMLNFISENTANGSFITPDAYLCINPRCFDGMLPLAFQRKF
jgi:hypothetical protein